MYYFNSYYRKQKVKRVVTPAEWEFRIQNAKEKEIVEIVGWCHENNLDVDTSKMSFLFRNEEEATLFALTWIK